MGAETSHARRRLIALLLARGEIGTTPNARPEHDEAPPERDERGERDAPTPARFERGDSSDRAA